MKMVIFKEHFVICKVLISPFSLDEHFKLIWILTKLFLWEKFDNTPVKVNKKYILRFLFFF